MAANYVYIEQFLELIRIRQNNGMLIQPICTLFLFRIAAVLRIAFPHGVGSTIS